MHVRLMPVFAATLLVCANCGKADNSDGDVAVEDPDTPSVETSVVEPPEPEVPEIPPVHPALQANQAFLIDFTKQEPGESWYIANHDVPTGQWKNDFRASSVKFSDQGMDLSIQLKEDWNPGNWFWDASEVQSGPTFHYGYYEVDLKIAKGSGLVTSMFTYTGPYYGTVHDEVDIEFVGSRTEYVEFNVFRSGTSYGSKRHELGFDASKEFHTYGFDWQPEYVHWFIDGELVHRLDNPDHVPTLPSKIMMNMWTGNLPQWHGHAQFDPGAKAQYRCLSYSPEQLDTPRCHDRD